MTMVETKHQNLKQVRILGTVTNKMVDWAKENGIDMDAFFAIQERYRKERPSNRSGYGNVTTEKLQGLETKYARRLDRIRAEIARRD